LVLFFFPGSESRPTFFFFSTRSRGVPFLPCFLPRPRHRRHSLFFFFSRGSFRNEATPTFLWPRLCVGMGPQHWPFFFLGDETSVKTVLVHPPFLLSFPFCWPFPPREETAPAAGFFFFSRSLREGRAPLLSHFSFRLDFRLMVTVAVCAFSFL